MSNVPADLRYTASHEWVRSLPDGTVEIGITDHAQNALGDLVFVEVPESGRAVKAGEACAVVESVKAASDVYTPLAGTVTGGNAELASSPELINQDPYGKGWMLRLKPADPAAVAAHGIGLRIQALAFVPALSVAQATGAMVGNALGAHDLPAAHHVVRASVRLNVAITTTLALLLVLGAHPIVAIFDVPEGTALHDLSVEWMRLLGYGMPIVGIHIAYVGALRGAGDTRSSLWINLVGTVVQVPTSWLLGFPLGMGPWGVWLGFPASFVLKAALGYAAYRTGRWARVGSRA